ncbi:hypothetical protein PGT21_026219 [Puccinia graminis f. sp. tritici]|uniref:Uncharacterized protein n=1 Tax=Puccinia graminis f. sp. tritici TaxID=56615 RepID=A0A5B0QK75_PUCGR|nr:hypothetical protein PGT21_026219 [Puccinia graminis f. sp. tritici]KAA1113617.1 hypothetical protein PGTUg99_008652 [Puccinia graminis f. sp. tritici]
MDLSQARGPPPFTPSTTCARRSTPTPLPIHHPKMRFVVTVAFFLALLQSASALPTLAKRGDAQRKVKLEAKSIDPNDSYLCHSFYSNCGPAPSLNDDSTRTQNPHPGWAPSGNDPQRISGTPSNYPTTNDMIAQSLKTAKDNNGNAHA